MSCRSSNGGKRGRGKKGKYKETDRLREKARNILITFDIERRKIEKEKRKKWERKRERARKKERKKGLSCILTPALK